MPDDKQKKAKGRNQGADYFEVNLSTLYEAEGKRKELKDEIDKRIQRGESLVSGATLEEYDVLQNALSETMLKTLLAEAEEAENRGQENDDA